MTGVASEDCTALGVIPKGRGGTGRGGVMPESRGQELPAGDGSGKETPFALSASGGRRSLDQTRGRGEGKQLGLRRNGTDPRLAGKMAREAMRGVGQGGPGEERMLLREASQIGASCSLPPSPEHVCLVRFKGPLC